MDYQKKYLKYKTKYLEEQSGGDIDDKSKIDRLINTQSTNLNTYIFAHMYKLSLPPYGEEEIFRTDSHYGLNWIEKSNDFWDDPVKKYKQYLKHYYDFESFTNEETRFEEFEKTTQVFRATDGDGDMNPSAPTGGTSENEIFTVFLKFLKYNNNMPGSDGEKDVSLEGFKDILLDLSTINKNYNIDLYHIIIIIEFLILKVIKYKQSSDASELIQLIKDTMEIVKTTVETSFFKKKTNKKEYVLSDIIRKYKGITNNKIDAIQFICWIILIQSNEILNRKKTGIVDELFLHLDENINDIDEMMDINLAIESVERMEESEEKEKYIEFIEQRKKIIELTEIHKKEIIKIINKKEMSGSTYEGHGIQWPWDQYYGGSYEKKNEEVAVDEKEDAPYTVTQAVGGLELELDPVIQDATIKVLDIDGFADSNDLTPEEKKYIVKFVDMFKLQYNTLELKLEHPGESFFATGWITDPDDLKKIKDETQIKFVNDRLNHENIIFNISKYTKTLQYINNKNILYYIYKAIPPYYNDKVTLNILLYFSLIININNEEEGIVNLDLDKKKTTLSTFYNDIGEINNLIFIKNKSIDVARSGDNAYIYKWEPIGKNANEVQEKIEAFIDNYSDLILAPINTVNVEIENFLKDIKNIEELNEYEIQKKKEKINDIKKIFITNKNNNNSFFKNNVKIKFKGGTEQSEEDIENNIENNKLKKSIKDIKLKNYNNLSNTPDRNELEKAYNDLYYMQQSWKKTGKPLSEGAEPFLDYSRIDLDKKWLTLVDELNNPNDKLLREQNGLYEVTRCGEKGNRNVILNAYGCYSANSEICHTDICVSLRNINYKEALLFLSDSYDENSLNKIKEYTSGRFFDSIYSYKKNSYTLKKIIEQILYLTFTGPQLVFIFRYLRNNLIKTLSNIGRNNEHIEKQLLYRVITKDYQFNDQIEDWKSWPDWVNGKKKKGPPVPISKNPTFNDEVSFMQYYMINQAPDGKIIIPNSNCNDDFETEVLTDFINKCNDYIDNSYTGEAIIDMMDETDYKKLFQWESKGTTFLNYLKDLFEKKCMNPLKQGKGFIFSEGVNYKTYSGYSLKPNYRIFLHDLYEIVKNIEDSSIRIEQCIIHIYKYLKKKNMVKDVYNKYITEKYKKIIEIIKTKKDENLLILLEKNKVNNSNRKKIIEYIDNSDKLDWNENINNQTSTYWNTVKKKLSSYSNKDYMIDSIVERVFQLNKNKNIFIENLKNKYLNKDVIFTNSFEIVKIVNINDDSIECKLNEYTKQILDNFKIFNNKNFCISAENLIICKETSQEIGRKKLKNIILKYSDMGIYTFESNQSLPFIHDINLIKKIQLIYKKNQNLIIKTTARRPVRLALFIERMKIINNYYNKIIPYNLSLLYYFDKNYDIKIIDNLNKPDIYTTKIDKILKDLEDKADNTGQKFDVDELIKNNIILYKLKEFLEKTNSMNYNVNDMIDDDKLNFLTEGFIIEGAPNLINFLDKLIEMLKDFISNEDFKKKLVEEQSKSTIILDVTKPNVARYLKVQIILNKIEEAIKKYYDIIYENMVKNKLYKFKETVELEDNDKLKIKLINFSKTDNDLNEYGFTNLFKSLNEFYEDIDINRDKSYIAIKVPAQGGGDRFKKKKAGGSAESAKTKYKIVNADLNEITTDKSENIKIIKPPLKKRYTITKGSYEEGFVIKNKNELKNLTMENDSSIKFEFNNKTYTAIYKNNEFIIDGLSNNRISLYYESTSHVFTRVADDTFECSNNNLNGKELTRDYQDILNNYKYTEILYNRIKSLSSKENVVYPECTDGVYPIDYVNFEYKSEPGLNELLESLEERQERIIKEEKEKRAKNKKKTDKNDENIDEDIKNINILKVDIEDETVTPQFGGKDDEEEEDIQVPSMTLIEELVNNRTKHKLSSSFNPYTKYIEFTHLPRINHKVIDYVSEKKICYDMVDIFGTTPIIKLFNEFGELYEKTIDNPTEHLKLFLNLLFYKDSKLTDTNIEKLKIKYTPEEFNNFFKTLDKKLLQELYLFIVNGEKDPEEVNINEGLTLTPEDAHKKYEEIMKKINNFGKQKYETYQNFKNNLPYRLRETFDRYFNYFIIADIEDIDTIVFNEKKLLRAHNDDDDMPIYKTAKVNNNLSSVLRDTFRSWSSKIIKEFDREYYAITVNGKTTDETEKEIYNYNDRIEMCRNNGGIIQSLEYFTDGNYMCPMDTIRQGSCCIGINDRSLLKSSLYFNYKLNDREEYNDVYFLHLWNERIKRRIESTEQSINTLEEVKAFSKGIIEDSKKNDEEAGSNNTNPNDQEGKYGYVIEEHWETSRKKYDESMKNFNINSYDLSGVADVIEQIYEIALNALESSIRNTLGRYVESDSRKKSWLEDNTGVWTLEKKDRKQHAVTKFLQNSISNANYIVSSIRDKVFNFAMLALRDPGVVNIILMYFNNVKKKICENISYILAKYGGDALRNYSDSPEIDVHKTLSEKASDKFSMGVGVFTSVAGSLGPAGEGMVNMMNKLELAKTLMQGALGFFGEKDGEIDINSLTSKIFTAAMCAFKIALHENSKTKLQDIQRAAGIESFIQLFTSPCIQSVNVAGMYIMEIQNVPDPNAPATLSGMGYSMRRCIWDFMSADVKDTVMRNNKSTGSSGYWGLVTGAVAGTVAVAVGATAAATIGPIIAVGAAVGTLASVVLGDSPYVGSKTYSIPELVKLILDGTIDIFKNGEAEPKHLTWWTSDLNRVDAVSLSMHAFKDKLYSELFKKIQENKGNNNIYCPNGEPDSADSWKESIAKTVVGGSGSSDRERELQLDKDYIIKCLGQKSFKKATNSLQFLCENYCKGKETFLKNLDTELERQKQEYVDLVQEVTDIDSKVKQTGIKCNNDFIKAQKEYICKDGNIAKLDSNVTRINEILDKNCSETEAKNLKLDKDICKK